MVEAGDLNAAAADLSPLALFMDADPIVQIVMLALLGASVWCWAIIFEKTIVLRDIWQRMEAFEKIFWSGKSLDDLFDKMQKNADNPMAIIFVSAMKEWRRSSGMMVKRAGHLRASMQQRIDRAMQISLEREMDQLESRIGFLATTGAVAPFVGLFGTVWGIMNSFSAIGMTKNTSLAVVAPGIAEALFATALGLVAAIPAVMAYNKISSDVDRLERRLDSFSGEFASMLSRQLDDHADDNNNAGE